MEYRYRNVKTKEVITTSNKISGAKWEAVEEAPPANDVPETPIAPAESPEADAAEKPKTARRKK